MTTYSVLDIYDPEPNLFDFFGTSVSGAGDVNGDGFSDVIIGSPYHDHWSPDQGNAYIYFGGSAMNANPDVQLLPDGSMGTGGEFGGNVSNAGDVNGDGFSDVIVGAPADGLVSLYFGGASMNNLADFTVFGRNGSFAGDVNGDGYSDFIIGANAEAYIFFGGSSISITPDIVLTGENVSDEFGWSVSGVGDLNGDGFSDVIVGANLNNAGGTYAGRAYVYFGGAAMDNVKDVILTGAAESDQFGYSVSGAGDFNGDGYSDLLVGAPVNDAGGTNAGRAYLYTNSLTGTDIPDEFFTGAAAGDYFGYSVSTAGDVNGDGYSDVIVGAVSNDAGGGDAGRAYIYFSGSLIDNTADVILTGAAAGDYFGNSISTAGDVNGDGYFDVIVGAFANDAGGTIAGRAYIYFGGASMNSIADVTLTGEALGDVFGYSVSTAEDVNGDGYSDVIVGASDNNAGGNSAGRAYIFFGGGSMDNIADVTLTGEAAGDDLGASVSSAGDVNGDGYSDVIVGARGSGGSFAGKANIYFGGVSMDNTTDVTLTGAAIVQDQFGCSVSSAGDVNGDGYSDVIVGAFRNDAGGGDAGRAYIYFGGSLIDNTADVILTGASAGDNFGNSVSTAGDVNGDGYSDVIVGAQYNDAGGTDAGRAYIYFGDTGMDNTADVILTGAAVSDWFGYSVSTAGDVNADGYSDLIVGANLNDAGGTDAGRAYLYLSSSPPIKPRIMAVKDVPFDQGGQVFLNFVRSGNDAIGESNIITEYLIEMSNPPGPTGFSWVQIGSVQPVQNPLYSFIAQTPNDSMTNNSGTYYFRITARTADPNQYWRSNILYGHSTDNLAPFAPFNFYANLNGNNVKLGWKANTEEDFRDYRVFRSNTPEPGNSTLIGTTTDTTFTDTSAVTGTAYYYIQSYDVHDNGSPYSSDSVMAFLSANIRVFLEGAYVGGQMSTFINTLGYVPLNQPYNSTPWNYTGTESVTTVPANVTDWVLVELRSTTTTIVDRRAAFLKNDGTLVDLDGVSNIKFPNAPSGNYYVVIKHRNHLSVMTSSPIAISFNPTLYDMRTDPSKVFGTNAMKNLGGGYYGIYTSDTDGSGTVNASDRSNTWNQRNLSGYYGTDVDLSGTVNAADRSSVWNNRNISTQVPNPVDGPITEIVKENNQ